MLSALPLIIAASFAFEPPLEEDGRPTFLAALQQAPSVVVAEVVETHDLEGEPVEEATITQVLKGAPGVNRVLYRTSSCSCLSELQKAKAGTPVLLLLSPGTDVRERRSFWQALDKVARPGEFFDLSWGPLGRLLPDGDGFVETGLPLPDSLPARTSGGSRGTRERRLVAFDVLVAWIQDRLAASEEPLR
jgi:hypothetical protein